MKLLVVIVILLLLHWILKIACLSCFDTPFWFSSCWWG